MRHGTVYDPAITYDGKPTQPLYGYDQLVETRTIWLPTGEPAQVGRVVGLLLLTREGYRDLKDVREPGIMDAWAYHVEYADGVSDEYVTAGDMTPLGYS